MKITGMFKKLISWLSEYWLFILAFIVGILTIADIVLTVFCYINYGNLPITEVPSWALPFMFWG